MSKTGFPDPGASDDLNTDLGPTDVIGAGDDDSGGGGIGIALGAFFSSKEFGAIAKAQGLGGGPKSIPSKIWGTTQVSTSGFTTYGVAPANRRPAAGRMWNLRSIYVFGGTQSAGNGNLIDPSGWTGGFTNGWQDQGFSTTAAAAAGATLTITTAYLESFRIDPAGAWPAGVNQVTVTNLQGGTQTYDLPAGTSNPLIVQFPEPVPAPFANPVITMPAIVGGPAYSINAIGRNLGNGIINPMAELYGATEIPQVPQGGAPFYPTPVPNLSSLVLGNMCPFPYYNSWGQNSPHWFQTQETPFVVFRNIAGSTQLGIWIATIDDYAVEDAMALAAPGGLDARAY